MTWYRSKRTSWVRLWRYGPGIQRTRVLDGLSFSQRNGYQRYVRLGGQIWTFIPNNWGRM